MSRNFEKLPAGDLTSWIMIIRPRGQVNWTEYNEINGETWPACRDLDGDGKAEIIIGLGQKAEDWMAIFEYADHQLKHVAWLNSGTGEIRLACGDVAGD